MAEMTEQKATSVETPAPPETPKKSSGQKKRNRKKFRQSPHRFRKRSLQFRKSRHQKNLELPKNLKQHQRLKLYLMK